MIIKHLFPQAVLAIAVLASPSVRAQHVLHNGTEADQQVKHAWDNRSLSPDERAGLVLKEMTVDEKIQLLHGNGMPGWGTPEPNAYLGNGGAGFVLGIERLGIPTIQMSDAAYGVRSSGENGRYSTALPSNLASAASWDPKAACDYGALIGRELRNQGYNMTLGGGTNLTREPRNGRTVEYMGEDPVLAGTLVGNRVRCEQAQHVVGDIKHYAVNDQESGRNEVDSIIGRRALRESDLLAFEIGLKVGDPAAVMCSYNAVNGDFACENRYLLTEVLRKEFHFKGFVLSDWGGTHSTVKASSAGLDNEEPLHDFYGAAMKTAVEGGKVPMAELDEHAHRMLRGEFASGIVDYPVKKSVPDVEAGFATARRLAEQSIVLLKNKDALLPLDAAQVHSIAVIGKNADMGMISGGGSAQVDSPGRLPGKWQEHIWFPTSPLAAIQAKGSVIQAKGSAIQARFAAGDDLAAAAALAKQSDVAIVFAYQWMSEGMDLPDLSLPDGQDKLIEAVAAANPKTIIVLETGTAVTMPWADDVSGILEAWYAGSKGADAVANILFGEVNPSAKLPMTFPRSEADLPHPQLVVPPPGAQGKEAVMKSGEARPTFQVHYDEGLKVGYKWYDAEKKKVLFPFGYGLSYTTFSYSGLTVSTEPNPGASFTVTNTGNRDGVEVAEVYASLPNGSGEPPKRLVGWTRVPLKAGERSRINLAIDPKYLSVFDEPSNGWKLLPGNYVIRVGGSSASLEMTKTFIVEKPDKPCIALAPLTSQQ